MDNAVTTGIVKHPVALELPPGLSFEEWLTIGQSFADADRSLRWWVGDWWAYGEHNYGERLKAIKEDKRFKLSFQSCVHSGSVSRQFETGRRRPLLTWSHHREVSMLEPTEQDKWLDRVEAEKLTREKLRELIKAEKAEKAEREAAPFVAPSLEKRAGPRITVPEGKTVEDLAREGIAVEAIKGKVPDAARAISVSQGTYRHMRDIVLLADRSDLLPRDRLATEYALADLNLNKQASVSMKHVADLAVRVWGINSKKMSRDVAERRLNENFDRAMNFISEICGALDSLIIPYLTKHRLSKTLSELRQSEKHLKALRCKIEKVMK